MIPSMLSMRGLPFVPSMRCMLLLDLLSFWAMVGKVIVVLIAEGGHNNFTVREFLVPFEQTARLCEMIYLPPFVVHGTYLLTDREVEAYGQLYHVLLDRLAKGEYDTKTVLQHEYLNDWLALNSGRVVS